VALAQVDPGDDPVRAGLLHGRLGGYLAATGGKGRWPSTSRPWRWSPAPLSAGRAGVLAEFGEALTIQARHRDSRALCEEAIAIPSQVGVPVEESHARRALGVDLATSRGTSRSSGRRAGSPRRPPRSTISPAR
jgi:hypothetical protein